MVEGAMNSKYLIIGSSHAALEAATAIRFSDTTGALTMLTRDSRLPYSPTILPYVVSGRSQPDKVMLRDEAWFRDNAIAFVPGATVVAVEPTQSCVRLASGERWTYERLLPASPTSASMCCARWTTQRRYATRSGRPSRRSCSAPA
jgi:phenylglyoxylate dehydrogenase epsilon subunit